MTTRLNPYLGFRDTARQAMEFYRSVFGGELTISTFGDFGVSDDPAESDKVMHSMLTTDGGFVLMGADTPDRADYIAGTNFSVSLSGDDATELQGWWDRLSDGGRIDLPLERAPWGDTFGMCTDRFGVSWMVNIAGAAD
ncbi:VOC family protein [Rhodococcus chondri]|uniref:VOC family protein n=1 Tax=Rhodococcus chondri TaxID=3065941 RepID=A0ABU7JX94_9NOCA|nr:VOC family protein [Rhodococcus sp. CC-R104]MEE2034139.1 VOC family protein [Rhodococcus sp. CC-R104]